MVEYTMQVQEVLTRLKSLSNQNNKEGMAKFGINIDSALGISIYTLRSVAKEIGMNHELAIQLWNSGIHEAKILASMIGEPARVTENLMEKWVNDFNSWDICDQVCCNYFDRSPFAYHKAIEWSARRKEFVKRAGFVLMATLSVHDKHADDQQFIQFFPIIMRESIDERNYVKKAVNWALRQIGKRNRELNKQAVQIALEIQKMDTKSARWIATNALRELTSVKVQSRLRKRK
jgi:3-methyladenine DNA glycosylase AlkD